MKYIRLPLIFFTRRRPVAAACLACVSLVLLGMGLGLSELLPLPGVAVAESAPKNHRIAPAVVSPERAGLLQSSVDSVALGLGSVLATLSGEQPRQAALAVALSSLTFELGGEVYFTAWQGTRIIHSPLTPDTRDMDFSDALDERGAAFVQTMESVAAEGGGFVQATLPRQLPRRTSAGFAAGGTAVSTPLYMNTNDAQVSEGLNSLSASIMEQAAARNTVSLGKPLGAPSLSVSEMPLSRGENVTAIAPQSLAAPESAMDATAVEQVVYIRRIPQSAWHIAAFMPVTTSPGFTGDGFSPAWSSAANDRSLALAAERDLRNGLCVSGFSLAGLAGLLMIPGRKDDEEEALLVRPLGMKGKSTLRESLAGLLDRGRSLIRKRS